MPTPLVLHHLHPPSQQCTVHPMVITLKKEIKDLNRLCFTHTNTHTHKHTRTRTHFTRSSRSEREHTVWLRPRGGSPRRRVGDQQSLPGVCVCGCVCVCVCVSVCLCVCVLSPPAVSPLTALLSGLLICLVHLNNSPPFYFIWIIIIIMSSNFLWREWPLEASPRGPKQRSHAVIKIYWKWIWGSHISNVESLILYLYFQKIIITIITTKMFVKGFHPLLWSRN